MLIIIKMSVFFLNNEPIFPDANYADDDGLLAVGGDLSAQRLLNAYANGIFPWYDAQTPILWWSPNPRLVMFPHKYKVSKGTKRLIKSGKFELVFDHDFPRVIRACAHVNRNGQDDTWIVPEMIEAYSNLHKLGYAHSVEAYYNSELAGGLYGVSIGKVFFGESMFHYESNASKVAFHYLIEKISKWNFLMIDSQVRTEHLIRLGAEEISRERYLDLLKGAIKEESKIGNWNELC